MSDAANVSSISGGRPWWRNPFLIIAAACLITIFVFGVRASFGVFLEPMTSERGWGREIFALAMAIQNLMWGAGQPFAGAVADRYGTARVLVAGLAVYITGVVLMAGATSPAMLHLSGGFLIGTGMSACSFSVVLAALGRLVPEDKRSWAFGIGTAAGSLGQFLVVPMGQAFLSAYGLSTALLLLAACMAIAATSAPLLASRGGSAETGHQQSIREALGEAFGHRSFVYLTVGFFVCGFQVSFLAVHLPTFIQDLGFSASLGAWSIAVVGLFNILGSYAAGVAGGRHSKRLILVWIYFLRAVVFAAFVLLPITQVSVLVFSAVMGVLWLSTVPPTSGLVAQMFGVRYMGMLFGVVFFSHQIGSFLGIWLGGYVYDQTGSYMAVWWLAAVLSLMSAIVHYPISEQPVVRAARAAA